MAYCPNCGSELTGGRKCPDCGHIDEDCTRCGTPLDDATWTCESCGTIRNFCPECGGKLVNGRCQNCGASRPPVCAECQSQIDPDVRECPACGYAPGSTRYKLGKAVQILGGLVILLGLFELVTMFTGRFAQMAPQSMLIQAAISLLFQFGIIAGLLVAIGWWAKRSAGTPTV